VRFRPQPRLVSESLTVVLPPFFKSLTVVFPRFFSALSSGVIDTIVSVFGKPGGAVPTKAPPCFRIPHAGLPPFLKSLTAVFPRFQV
jgi:hypothetical protein